MSCLQNAIIQYINKKKAFLSSGKLEKSFQSLCSMLIHLSTCGVFIKNVLAPNLNEYIPVT